MRTILATGAVLVASLLLLAPGLAAVDGDAAPAPDNPPPARDQPADAGGVESDAPAAELDGGVQMVELVFDGRKVRGRIVLETDELMRIESVGGGIIGYGKDDRTQIRRFSIGRCAYYEEQGDYFRERAWKVEDAPTEFVKARQAYQQALAHAEVEEDRVRLEARLAGVASDRDEWQKEVMRKAEIDKARQEAELVRLEQELTRQKLTTLRRHENNIQQLRTTQAEMEQQMGRIIVLLEDLDRKFEDLEDDVHRLRYLDRTFITQTVFLDLKRSHVELERQVGRLERQTQRK